MLLSAAILLGLFPGNVQEFVQHCSQRASELCSFLRNSNNRITVRSILLFKKLLGRVELTSGLVNVSFSLPKWQAVKMIFFAP